ncbi:eukaryotic and archaeal DNA primase, large subunit-domain-containing protein [Kockovaella imperatae]|uniref:DNA primase large subunit n=1 Tax=Kockovaella imperatae TaxID=4999 RepID=A0A1Y1U7J3_9TREE|nr:eukaryotic and archaeal DNA primase, large subunit-domain-containing protein [Kockovaella imperatae]ORX33982.1 eukaryotic and archaeal DNA primase, large subunit-domain-containing protein [Kockovaella imperatae]
MFKPSTRHNLPALTADVKINKRQSTSASSSSSSSSSRWPYRLNFYDQPPVLDITLEEFEVFAIARLRVLTHIEALSHRSLPFPQFSSAVGTYLKQHLPLSSNTARNVNVLEERRKDEIGHWVLRLAFCRSPDLRARFLRSELALFRQRFETDDAAERAAFLKSLQFDWQLVDAGEKARLETELKTCLWTSGTSKDEAFRAESWFKVPWHTVPDLVGQRRVYINGGMAYVPQSLQISLVLQAFGSRLERALELTAKNLPRLDEDERLGPVLDHLATSFLSGLGAAEYQSESDGNGTTVTADMVDDVARKHFPPCMRNLYDRLKRDHHLKHFARLQLGLFLKGIGLPLDEAVVFWRRMYGATMSDDKFNKEYKYNIRHGYGQEGKRMNYAPKSCQAILTINQPGTQDSHGCPFRHFSPDNLVIFLLSTYPQLDRSSPEMRDILDSVKTSHYHVACTRVFEVTHGLKKGQGLGPDGETVTHPNKFVDRSREMERDRMEAIKAKEGGGDEDVKMD